MPIGPIKTKAQKRNVVHQEMHAFKHGDLHSGSKTGPIVTNPKQAIAIALHESGQSKSAKQPHPRTNPGCYDNEAHDPEGGYMRKGQEFRPGADQAAEDAVVRTQENLAADLGMQPADEYVFRHQSLQRAHTFGHSVGNREGSLRLSGNPNAHQIGKRK